MSIAQLAGPIPRFTGTPATTLPQAPAESSVLVRRYPSAPDAFSFEPSSRWVRAVVGDTAVVDSRHQLLVWEPRHKVPEYAFPLEHVRTDLLEPASRPADADRFYRPATRDVQWYDLVLGERRIPGAAWKWNVPGLEGYIGVNWFDGVLDGWFEEDERVITHPRDPHNRIDVIASSRHVVVVAGDRVLAESHRPTLLFENGLPTRFYLPPDDVDWAQLEAVDLVTECPYKGYADRYWRLTGTGAGGDGSRDGATDAGREVAWSYSDPFHQVSAIRGLIAFYNERLELTVDGAPFLDSRRTWA